MSSNDHVHERGLVRREFLQVGFSGLLGLGLPGLLAGRAAATATQSPRAKSVILVFLTGGPSHIDTFDPKPDAPDAIRGEFATVATKAPGVSFCEHLPGMSARADRLAVIRSLSHAHTNHLNATHQVLTGHPQPNATFDKIASRDDYPCYGSALNYMRPRSDGIPSGVMLPTFLMEGPLVWPGQHAGFLGPRHDPWQIKGDPNSSSFREESLRLPDGFSVERLDKRRNLLDDLNETRDRLARDPMSEQRDLAYSLLLSGKVAKAFDLNREDPKTRDRYGRHLFGQSMLLAKRLAEAGVPIVQANMGRVQNWDTHGGNFKRLKNDLLPPLDKGVSALLDDLDATGMLEETLVIVAGEFGRTPRVGQGTGNVNQSDGRDHWSKVFSAVFAGAGVRGGQVIGASDKIGAYATTGQARPEDLAATMFEALGIDPESEIRDKLGRPLPIARGKPIREVFA